MKSGSALPIVLGLVTSSALLCTTLSRADVASDRRLQLLNALNAARAQPRTCGTQSFPAAPAWRIDGKLTNAALVHAADMAKTGVLSHTASNGTTATDWAKRQLYPATQALDLLYGSTTETSPQAVVNAWLAAPANCALIMNTSYGLVDAGAGEKLLTTPAANGMKEFWSVVIAKTN